MTVWTEPSRNAGITPQISVKKCLVSHQNSWRRSKLGAGKLFAKIAEERALDTDFFRKVYEIFRYPNFLHFHHAFE